MKNRPASVSYNFGSYQEEQDYLKIITSNLLSIEPTIDVIVYLPAKHQSQFVFLIILISKGNSKKCNSISTKIDIASKEYPLITFVGTIDGIKNNIANIPQFYFDVGQIIYSKIPFSLPPFRVKLTDEQLQVVYSVWENEGSWGHGMYYSALKNQLDGNSAECLFILTQVVKSLLLGVVGIQTGYLPQKVELLRLIDITLLFTTRIYNIFHKECQSSSEALSLLIARKHNKIEWDRYNEAALNVLMLNTLILSIITEESYFNQLTLPEKF